MSKTKLSFLACLLLSFNFHVISFGILSLDFSEVHLKLSAKEAVERIEQVLSDSSKTIKEKIDALMKSAKHQVQANLEEISKVKVKDPTSGLAKEAGKGEGKGKGKDGKGKGEDSNSKFADKEGDGRGHIPGFGGFLPAPPIEVSIIERPKQRVMSTTNPLEVLKPEPGEIIMASILPGKDCPEKDSYGGVGIQFKKIKGSPDHEVDLLAPNQPAEKAGMRKGDVIKGDPLRFKGDKGSAVTIEYYRDGQRRLANVKREKICFKREIVKIPPSKNQM